ncbi:unnamed protein product [Adineta ricciae]|uniref:G-protein coupled receptors family 1 profile domain-containing protein n=1 Tax=Adineta ricciae TaxID=249248 RepID=A0A814UAT9_ADIRI|nr:unnamed protein product [Adineta ricciae]CAF1172400.1 unnamed protein product [Adineta ricciae]
MSTSMRVSTVTANISIYGYGFTFVFGIIGHILNLITFTRRQIRSTSTSIVFLIITIFDICYLLMSLYDFLFINLNLPQTSPNYIFLCRFRTFIINFVQTVSPWLLVCIAIDRLIRAHSPHQYKTWCTKQNAALVIFLTIACSIAFNSHVLQNSFTTMFPTSHVVCGPPRINMTNYAVFYYSAWTLLQVCINILLPALCMILSTIVICRKVRNIVVSHRNQQFQKQMLLLMFSKIILFLTCTLPYGAYRTATIASIDLTNPVEHERFLLITAILTIFLNANYSLTFYVHCLTSTLFRRALSDAFKHCYRRTNKILPLVRSINRL